MTTRLPPSPPRPARETYQGFRIGPQIGRGAMGIVYSGRDALTGEQAAIKLVELRDETASLRFRRSIQVRLGTRHEAILPLWAHGQDGRQGFLVSPLLEPESLADRFDPAVGMTFRGVQPLIRQVAGALQALHDSGWIHRDVKPDNVLFSARGPVLIDFGLTKRRQTHGPDSDRYRRRSVDETQPHLICGTPIYMSPQRLHGDPAEPGDDVYALALTAVELLSGTLPGTPERGGLFALTRARAHALDLGRLSCPLATQTLLEAALSPVQSERPRADELALL